MLKEPGKEPVVLFEGANGGEKTMKKDESAFKWNTWTDIVSPGHRVCVLTIQYELRQPNLVC